MAPKLPRQERFRDIQPLEPYRVPPLRSETLPRKTNTAKEMPPQKGRPREVSPFVAVVGPGAKPPIVRRAISDAAEEFAERLYCHPDGPRRLVDYCIEGKFSHGLEWVYFIGPEVAGPIKIGVARDPVQRLRDIQVGHPDGLVLFAAVRGGRELEHMLHAVFHRDRLRGEWFSRSSTLAEVVRLLSTKNRAVFPKG